MSNEDEKPERGLMRDLWGHPWGRVLVAAMTIAVVSWAIRETAAVTFPVITAIGDILVPLVIGFTIAYVLTPIVDAFSRHGMRRLVATFVLFSVFIVVGSLTLAFGVPAIISQSAELVTRTVEDQPFLDRDGNGMRARHEPLLRAMPDSRGRFFHDINDNRVPDPSEPVYRRGRDQVAEMPSMARHVLNWLGEQQSRVERYVGTELDPGSVTFIEFHRQALLPFSQRLDEGLEVGAAGIAVDDWPAWMQADNDDRPLYDVLWQRSWPGVTQEEFDAADAKVPVAKQSDWRTVMTRYGRAWTRRHQDLLDAWRLVQETDVTGPATTGFATEPFAILAEQDTNFLARQLRDRLARASALGDGFSGELADYIDRLQTARTERQAYARELFHGLERTAGDASLVDTVLDGLNQQLRSNVENISDDVTQNLGAALSVGGVLGFALDLVLVPIYAFFLTLAMPTLRSSVRRALPEWNREMISRILHDIERVVAAFFRGRLIVCLLCAALVAIGFLVAGVPYAIIFGLAIGLATTVPLSGLLFLIPAVLLTVIEHPDDAVLYATMAVTIYAVVQTLEMTVFTPLIMGREVELHPVMLIIALLFFGKILGVIGVILAVPIAATLRILAREFVWPRLKQLAAMPAEQSVWSTVTGMISRPRSVVVSGVGEAPEASADDGAEALVKKTDADDPDKGAS